MKNKKPLWIALGAVAGIFLIAAAIALIAGIAGRGGKRESSTEDAPYPYSWEEKDGVITLTLTGKDVKDGFWRCVSSSVVEVDAGKTRGSDTTFTLSPVEPGREKVTFLLSNGEYVVAEAVFTVEVERREDDRLSASVYAHEERALQGTLTGGTDSDYPFTITAENGALLLKIADPALADAVSESDDEAAAPAEEPVKPAEEPAEPAEGSTETKEESDSQTGPSLTDEEEDNSEPPDDEEPPDDDESSAFASDNWHIATTDSLVARMTLMSIESGGITFRIETDVNGEATLTLYNPVAKVAYMFSLVSRRGVLTVSGYQACEELPVNQMTQEDLEQSITDTVSGLQPYTPPPVPEEQEGDQDDGLGKLEAENG